MVDATEPGAARVAYLVSAALDYGLTIAPDVGPAYAADMGWEVAALADLEALVAAGRPVVVDNRLRPDECHDLLERLRRLDGVVALKVVDPYVEQRDTPWWRLLRDTLDVEHVRYLSVYRPVELTAELADVAGDRLVHVPYVYRAEHEVDVPHRTRRRELVFAGAVSARYYPARTALLGARRRSLVLRRRIAVLPHPGYPDVGPPGSTWVTGAVRGAAFVERLASSTAMFLDPSRAAIELLKYRECAYAGCVPVGPVPDGLDAALVAALQEVDPARPQQAVRHLLRRDPDELDALADGYREALRSTRSYEALAGRVAAAVR